jgi:formate dehydrogenase major subunit
MIQVSINGTQYEAAPGERLIDAINRAGVAVAGLLSPAIGPIQTCDTSIVEVNSELIRACAWVAVPGLKLPRLERKSCRSNRGIRPNST